MYLKVKIQIGVNIADVKEVRKKEGGRNFENLYQLIRLYYLFIIVANFYLSRLY